MIRGPRARHIFGVSAFLVALALSGTAAVPAQGQTKLASHARYPRIRQLANGELLASVVAYDGDGSIDLFVSRDDGVSFARVGSISDPEFATGHCCSTIFQLPRAVGLLPAGTLIAGVTVGSKAPDRRMKIKIYKSIDNGRHWSLVSTAATSANKRGLWEPEFSIADDGAIVMFYSDESQPCCSQKLVERRSYDGTSWIDQTDVVVGGVYSDRPGMAVVSKLANGDRYMTYEICGPAHRCAAFYRTSSDGWNWGDATSPGIRIQYADGRYPAHTPVNEVLPDGTILVTGQMLLDADGSTAKGNGTTIFKSESGNPAGPWTAIAAPVPVPDAYDNACPNYSPGMRWVAGGTILVELSERLEGGLCTVYFARGTTK